MVTSDIGGPAPRVTVRQPLAWIDTARIAATLAVIAIHVVSPLVTSSDLGPSWWFGNVIDSAARWSVPGFVMISGALLLHSDLADDPASFYRRRLARILPPLIAWTVIFLVLGHLILDNPRTLPDALFYLFLGRPASHLYFLFLITGLYLIAPFLRPLVARADRRVLSTAVLVFLGLGIADGLVVAWGGVGQVNAVTRFVPYVGYFLAGAWLVGLPPSRFRMRAAAATAAGGILATALGTGLLVDRLGPGQGLYLYEYLSVTSVPTSLAVFVLFVWSAPSMERMAARLPPRWLSLVAASTLGIYIIHPLVIRGLGMLGLTTGVIPVPLAVPAIALATFLVSLGVVLVMRRLPVLRLLV